MILPPARSSRTTGFRFNEQRLTVGDLRGLTRMTALKAENLTGVVTTSKPRFLFLKKKPSEPSDSSKLPNGQENLDDGLPDG